MSQSNLDYAMQFVTEDDDAESSLSSSFSITTPSNALDSLSSRFEDVPEDAQKITLLGRTFVLESSLAKRRPRSGWFWKHDRALVECSSKTPYFHCLECKKKTWLLMPYSIDHIHAHLRKEHSIGPEGKLVKKGSMDRALQSTSSSLSPSGDTTATLITKLQLETSKKLVMRWIVCMRITFSQVESDEFSDLVIYLHSGLRDWLPASGRYDSIHHKYT